MIQKIRGGILNGIFTFCIRFNKKNEKDFEKGISLLKNRHPYLNKFLGSDYTVLFRLDVENFIYVTHFQEVFEWKP